MESDAGTVTLRLLADLAQDPCGYESGLPAALVPSPGSDTKSVGGAQHESHGDRLALTLFQLGRRRLRITPRQGALDRWEELEVEPNAAGEVRGKGNITGLSALGEAEVRPPFPVPAELAPYVDPLRPVVEVLFREAERLALANSECEPEVHGDSVPLL
ncbi:hypothetical protein GCM10010342_35270 [Streptomyces anulatus]|nr:hypothetical protein GCM10010342_35270 [Streptomyces anulatus]